MRRSIRSIGVALAAAGLVVLSPMAAVAGGHGHGHSKSSNSGQGKSPSDPDGMTNGGRDITWIGSSRL